jgi:hypothetical protein
MANAWNSASLADRPGCHMASVYSGLLGRDLWQQCESAGSGCRRGEIWRGESGGRLAGMSGLFLVATGTWVWLYGGYVP